MMRDRGFVAELIQRALKAECSALVLTVDLQVQGQRHCDVKNGFTIPYGLSLNNIFNMVSKPCWTFRMLGSTSKSLGNFSDYPSFQRGFASLSEFIVSNFDSSLNWKDVGWIREQWPEKLIIKGIMDVEDARHAINVGVDAIVVSNYGGRQLDSAPSAIEVLARIVDAVNNEIEILFDSGIRSGQNVIKAMALGVKGVMIGRTPLYGLGAMAKEGVLSCLHIIRNELDVSIYGFNWSEGCL